MRTTNLHPGLYVRLRNGNNALIVATPTDRTHLPTNRPGTPTWNNIQPDRGKVTVIACDELRQWGIDYVTPQQIARPLTLEGSTR